MDLTFEHLPAGAERMGIGEPTQPHSLRLALQRMGFRPRPERQPRPRWPRSWQPTPAADATGDWQPL